MKTNIFHNIMQKSHPEATASSVHQHMFSITKAAIDEANSDNKSSPITSTNGRVADEVWDSREINELNYPENDHHLHDSYQHAQNGTSSEMHIGEMETLGSTSDNTVLQKPSEIEQTNTEPLDNTICQEDEMLVPNSQFGAYSNVQADTSNSKDTDLGPNSTGHNVDHEKCPIQVTEVISVPENTPGQLKNIRPSY